MWSPEQICYCYQLTTLKRPRWKVRTTTQGVTAENLLFVCTLTAVRAEEAESAAAMMVVW
jgi:hypothetical protein